MTDQPSDRRSGERRARSALVIGGGIAGATAALRLADRGLAVTLVEARPRLGGLVFSFPRESAAGTLTVDNGQHLYLGCCTAYRWFLDRIGSADLAPLTPLDIPVLDARRGRLARLRRRPLPVPLHLAGSLAGYQHLSVAERLMVVRATLALGRLDPRDPALDRQNFAAWLRRHGQSDRCVAALWDLVGVATLNARAGDVSLALAAKVFRTGLLSSPGAADIGLPRVPLGDLHDTRTRAALERAGVRVLSRTKARRVCPAGPEGGWRVTVSTARAGGQRSEGVPDGPRDVVADAVVLALPQRETHQLLPEGSLAHPERLLELGTAPILNVHVVYDRPVLRRPFFAALGSPIQWVFDRSGPSGLTAQPGTRGIQYLALSQSAAQEEIDLPAEVLRKRYLPELSRLLPTAADAGVVDFFVTRERTATFAPAPGVGRLRPGPDTAHAGLKLAGAWTATGWPATMEGAVRSGLAAADRVVPAR